MKTHHAKTLMLLLTACLTLDLPSIAQSQFKDLSPDGGPKNEEDSDKSARSFENGLSALDGVALDEAIRRANNAEGSGSGSVALQSFSRVENEVSSSRSLVEKAANDLKFCKLDCRKQEVGCLKGADPSNIFAGPSCRNKFAKECKLGCTQRFFNDVTLIPDPRISGEGQGAHWRGREMKRQKQSARWI